jgi:hypothetical protein
MIDVSKLTPKTPTREIEDSGTVRIGNASPSFPPVRPATAKIEDSGAVRIGNASPSFPPVR